MAPNPALSDPDAAPTPFGPAPFGPGGFALSLVAILAATAALTFAALAALRGFAALAGAPGALDQGLRLLGRGLADGPPAAQLLVFAFLGAFFYSLLAATLVAARWRGGRGWRALAAWRRPVWPFRPVWLLLLAAAFPAYLVGASTLIRLIDPHFRTWFFVPSDPAGMALSLFVVAVMAPLAEEILFRGWAYTHVKAMAGAPAAVIATTLAFAAAHFDGGLLYPAAILVPGLLFALVREWTGSALGSFFAHGWYNGFAWIMTLVASGW